MQFSARATDFYARRRPHHIIGAAVGIVAVTSVAWICFGDPARSSAATNVPPPPPSLHTPGMLNGTGTFFAVTDSPYLNVSLESAQPIKLYLESMPNTISLVIEPTATSTASTTTLTLKGLTPNTIYYLYQDNHHHETVFISGGDGSYTWVQDISTHHYVSIQTEPSTTFINSDGGGDCSTVGTWATSTETCTLTKDVDGTIEIDSDGITLNGNGHTITYNTVTGSDTGDGILIPLRSNVTVKNVSVAGFYAGITVVYASNTTITGTHLFGNSTGINDICNTGGLISNNNISNNSFIGINVYETQDSNISQNVLDENGSYGLLFEGSGNTVIGNRANDNGYAGLGLSCTDTTNNVFKDNAFSGNYINFYYYIGYLPLGYVQTNSIDTSNTVNGKPIYFLSNVQNQTLASSTNAGLFYCFNCSHVVIQDVTFSESFFVFNFYNTSHSIIDGITFEPHEPIATNLVTFIGSDNNKVINSTFNQTSVDLSSSSSNIFYHNNFVESGLDVSTQNSLNVLDNGLPDGGNYWSSEATSCVDANGDGICDSPYYVYSDVIDHYPWKNENGWEAMQVPTISNLGQFKLSGVNAIPEGAPFIGNTAVFKATVTSPAGGDIKMEVEVKPSGQAFNGTNTVISAPVASGDIASATVTDLIPEAVQYTQGGNVASFHWRARAIDSQGRVSPWQDFGTAGSADFTAHVVPLYTQEQSPYPSIATTHVWSILPYDNGEANAPGGCGLTIAQCGCAITSAVMVARYYGASTSIDGNGIDPGTMNAWLENNDSGYVFGGALNWGMIPKYTGYQIAFENRLKISGANPTSADYSTLSGYLDNLQPVILYEATGRGGYHSPHFLVADSDIGSTYSVSDPYWYDTQTLSEISSDTHVRDYNNNFDSQVVFNKGNGLAVNYLLFALGSPAQLLLTDSEGRREGVNPVTGVSYNEIPGGTFFTEGIGDPAGTSTVPIEGTKELLVMSPEDGHYTLQVIGTGNGSYSLESVATDSSGNTKVTTSAFQTATGVTETYQINYSSTNANSAALKEDMTSQELLALFKATVLALPLPSSLQRTLSNMASVQKKLINKNVHRAADALISSEEHVIQARTCNVARMRNQATTPKDKDHPYVNQIDDTTFISNHPCVSQTDSATLISILTKLGEALHK